MKAGWRDAKLSDICDLITDGSHFSPVTTPSGYPYITVRDIEGGRIDFGECKFISDADFQKLRRNGCKPRMGDVLFSKDGTVGKVALVDRELDFVVLSSLAIIRPSPKYVTPEFLECVMRSPSVLLAATGLKTGTAIRRIILRNLKSIIVPVPPLPEQRRIVGILHRAFDGIATAKANAERNVESASALFESCVWSALSKPGVGWTETAIADETELLPGFAFKSGGYTAADDGIRLLRGDNIVPSALRWDDVMKWPSSDVADYARYQLREGDIVLAMDRPWVSAGLKCAMLRRSDLSCLLVQRVARIRSGQFVDRRFLFHLLRSSAFSAHIQGVQTGSGVPHISGQQIQAFRFRRPSLDEQRHIASRLDQLDVHVRQVASDYEDRLDALDALKQSLLQEAFTGQL